MRRRAAEVPWVTASAIGQATYCPYQLYLARTGAVRDAASEAAVARGGRAHEAWTDTQRRSASTPRVGAVRTALKIAAALALVVALGLIVLLISQAIGRP